MRKNQNPETLSEIKKKLAFTAYDVHTNPADVFSIVEIGNDSKSKQFFVPGPSLLEKLNYNFVALTILEILFLRFPVYMSKTVIDRYKGVNERYFTKTFLDAGIDKVVALPALSSEKPLRIYDYFRDKNKYIRLGTIDLHNIEPEQISPEINRQIHTLGIRGLKFNPNIQRFYPEPSSNNKKVKEKLEIIYSEANKNKLFLLIHAGISFTPRPNSPKKFEKVSFGKLENFLPKNQSVQSFIADLNVPIIIAHMGHYNLKKINYELLNFLTRKYNTVFFDTAGVSTKIIKRYIEENGLDRVLFGSDMLYFDVGYAVASILRTLSEVSSPLTFHERVQRVFSDNFTNNFLKLWNT